MKVARNDASPNVLLFQPTGPSARGLSVLMGDDEIFASGFSNADSTNPKISIIVSAYRYDWIGQARASSVPKHYERKLKGRSYWSIFYKPKQVPGRGFKGGGATVLIDSKTGQVLLAIRGE